MNHKNLHKPPNVKEKRLQQTRLPKGFGWLYARKVRFACSQFLDDVSLQVGSPPRTSHTLSLIPIKLHKQPLATATGCAASGPHPLRLKPTEFVAGGFVPITDSAHKHYSGKIPSPTLSNTPENRERHPTVSIFSHKFTNSWYLRRK